MGDGSVDLPAMPFFFSWFKRFFIEVLCEHVDVFHCFALIAAVQDVVARTSDVEEIFIEAPFNKFLQSIYMF